jgi:hypothetical protein
LDCRELGGQARGFERRVNPNPPVQCLAAYHEIGRRAGDVPAVAPERLGRSRASSLGVESPKARHVVVRGSHVDSIPHCTIGAGPPAEPKPTHHMPGDDPWRG